MRILISLITTSFFLCQPKTAQSQTAASPYYQVTIVGDSIKAINYMNLKGATKIDFKGTALLPQARGVANIKNDLGAVTIEAKFSNLEPPAKFGPQYLTYVLWAISPEGRATNLGELILKETESRITVTTQMQSFALIVTAEPYFAVTQIGPVVVLENVARENTLGKINVVDAKFESAPQESITINTSQSFPNMLDKKIPLHLYQARNAVNIARWAGAETHASTTYKKAESLLRLAEQYQTGKRNLRKQVPVIAREAVQTAEDARLIAMQRIEKYRLDLERAEALKNLNRAKEQALEETRARVVIESDKTELEKARREAESARAEAEFNQQVALSEAEEARNAAEHSDIERKKSEEEKAGLRMRLMEQLNLILETRDTARGLIVNMSDILFETGKAHLPPAMRENLAKISGVLLAHPGLKLAVEGHTDSAGSDELNQALSEERAEGVRDYLIQQGISAKDITAQGFGETRPIAANQSAEGRQKNRRVELVVTGESIEE